ncbi:MAG: hypothetical protein ABSE63_11135 [Thermoguttaceae bacterium]
MRGAMGVKTPEKSEKWKLNCWSISVIFGHFSWFLAGMIFHEKGRLLDGLCPEGAEERLETGGWRTEGSATENAENTEK